MSAAQRQIAQDIAGFIDDPAGFVLYVFPWGKPGTALQDFPNGPDQWQLDEFESMAKHIRMNADRKALGLDQIPYQSAIASGHGIGKSAFVAWLILFFMSTRYQCRGVVTANTGDQLEDKTWPELAKWHNLSINRSWFKLTATKFYSIVDTNGENNWKFDCVTWSEERTEAFAGLHNAASSPVLIFDEASAIPDVIWEVSEGAMTDGEPFWFAFGNPTRNTGRFRECFGKFRHRWRTRHIDSRTVRITNKTLLNQWVQDYGEDSDFVRVRVRGQFPRGGGKQFIPVDIVEAAQQRELVPDIHAPLIMGVDVARHGDDQSVIRFRQGRDARSIKPLKYRGLDSTTLADRICEAIDRYHPDAVAIDAGNTGAAIIDILKGRRYRVVEVWFGAESDDRAFRNKRAMMWGRLKDWLPGGCIDKDQELYHDLIGPEYEADDNGVITLEPKAKMKKRGLASPDDGDALALTFAVRVARRDSRTYRDGRRAIMAKGVGASPFAR
jgi:hypothetical protein